jgi:hypothetical protein
MGCRAVDDETPQNRAEYFLDVAETLRGIAGRLPYDLRRADQLRALADGFERFAARLEREANTE